MPSERAKAILVRLGVPAADEGGGEPLESVDPATGRIQGRIHAVTRAQYDARVVAALRRFEEWRMRPAPKRGEVIRGLGELLRAHKEPLGELVSLETGKIRAEGAGEVQEMIDICDFAVGLSRQLHGLTIASERPRHRLTEQWHPLGAVGIVTAFNFPVAVWSWNAALAAVCGDVCLWKPSPLTPLCSAAVQTLCEQVAAEHGAEGVFNLVPGDAELDLAVRAITFGAVGTAGQRCTSTRRLFVQRGVARALIDRLVSAYRSVRIGDPLEQGVWMGPLITRQAVDRYRTA